jgi:hypothetical protein
MRLNDLASQLVEASESGSSIEKDLGKTKSYEDIDDTLSEFIRSLDWKSVYTLNHLNSLGIKLFQSSTAWWYPRFQLEHWLRNPAAAVKLFNKLNEMNLSGASKSKYIKEVSKSEIFRVAEIGDFNFLNSRFSEHKIKPTKSDIKKTVSEIQKKLDAFGEGLLVVAVDPETESTITDGGMIRFRVYVGQKLLIAITDAVGRIANRFGTLKYVDFPTEKELADYLQSRIGGKSNGYFYFGKSLLTVEPIGYEKIVRDGGIIKYGVHISIASKEGGQTENLGNAIYSALLEKYGSIYRYNQSPIFNVSRSAYESYGTFDGISYYNIDPSDELLARWNSKTLPKYKMDANLLEPAKKR